MSKTVKIEVGGGWLLAIGAVLVTLKLLGVAPVAEWSWWIVTLPFWFGIAVVAAFLLMLLAIPVIGLVVTLFGVLMVSLIDWYEGRRK